MNDRATPSRVVKVIKKTLLGNCTCSTQQMHVKSKQKFTQLHFKQSNKESYQITLGDLSYSNFCIIISCSSV